MDSKKIGEFIKNKRIEQKMTQEELANKIYVSNKTISKWETGKGIPSVDMLEPLSRVLGVTIAEILSGEKPAKDMDLLLVELKNKKRKRIINLVGGIFGCLFLCFLEVVLYASGIDSKFGYLIMGGVIICFLIFDIANYFINKNK